MAQAKAQNNTTPAHLAITDLDTFAFARLSSGVELKNSTDKAEPDPKISTQFPMFRGRYAHVQAARLKAWRLDFVRVLNPRSASILRNAVAPVTNDKGATP